MTPARAAARRSAESAGHKENLRAFHRRWLRLPVVVVDVAGEVIAPGTEAVANLEFPGRGKIQTGVRLVWGQTHEGRHEYGARFTDFSGEDRLALMEAIFGPVEGGRVESAFDVAGWAGDADAVRALRPLPESHHAYYIRLIRRLERAHKLSPADVDRLLFAVLHERRDLPGVLLAMNLTTYDRLEE